MERVGDRLLTRQTPGTMSLPCPASARAMSGPLSVMLIDNGYRVLFARTTDLVQKLQTARQELSLAAAIEKLDKYHLLNRRKRRHRRAQRHQPLPTRRIFWPLALGLRVIRRANASPTCEPQTAKIRK
jgi:hypothetical protein